MPGVHYRALMERLMSSESGWVVVLVAVILGWILLAHVAQKSRQRPDQLSLVWSQRVDRPWPLDVAKNSILVAGLGGRKSVNIRSLEDGRRTISFETLHCLSAARGSLSSDGGHAVLGNEVWQLCPDGPEPEPARGDCKGADAKSPRDAKTLSGRAKMTTVLKMPHTDMRSTLKLFRDPSSGRLCVVRAHWDTQWVSASREYRTHSVGVHLISAVSGEPLGSVFGKDWTQDSKVAGADGREFTKVSCRLSPNRNYLAVHAKDKRNDTIRLMIYNIRRGALLLDLTPPSALGGWCNLLRWSPDGSLVATSYLCHSRPRARLGLPQNTAGYVLVWDTVRGNVRRLDLEASYRTSCFAFSRGGILALGGFDGSIVIVKVRTGEILSRTEGAFSGPIHRMCFTCDGARLLATGSSGDSRFTADGRLSVLKNFKVPEPLTFASIHSRVDELVKPYIQESGLRRLIAEYAW